MNALQIVIWPLIFLILGILFILNFHRQIEEYIFKPFSGFIKRWENLKVGREGFEANAPPQEKIEKDKLEKKEEEISEDTYEEERKEVTKTKEMSQPKTLDEWRSEMLFASLERDAKRAKEAYQEVMKLNDDKLSRKEDEILYLRFSHIYGNIDAIPELKKSLSDNEIAFEVNMALGFCYSNSDDFKNASLFYSKALQLSRDDSERSRATSNYSWSLYRDDKKDKAIGIISEVLSSIRDDSGKVELYESLAGIYEKENDYENRAFVLDKALELKPNNADLLFKTGYSYSESKYDELSLLHYKKARDINPKDESVQNNLGVQYDNLKMPIKSILSYREAEKFGNTLASANLAYRLIQSGFIAEASGILNLAKEKKNVHPNVDAAFSEISKDKDRENKSEEERIKFALELRKFFLEFVEAKYIKGNTLKSVATNWKLDDGTVFTFEIIGNKIRGIWKRKLWNYEYEHKLEGEIFNNSSVIDFYEKEYNLSSQKYEYKKKHGGFLFCSPSGNSLKFIEIDSDTKKINTLKLS